MELISIVNKLVGSQKSSCQGQKCFSRVAFHFFFTFANDVKIN